MRCYMSSNGQILNGRGLRNEPRLSIVQAQGRREFLRDAFCGFGSLALAALWQGQSCQGANINPLAAKPAPHAAKAKSVIFLFMAGGPSHMESFDPKPLLNQLNGEKKPEEFGEARYQFVRPNARLLGSKRTFKKYGQNGIEVS